MPTSDAQFGEFLERIAPGVRASARGANSAEIESLVALTPWPLPGFYRWFLATLANDLGPAAYDNVDFSPAKLLSCYQQGLVRKHPNLLLIGFDRDPVLPMHFFYDLSLPVRDDARVARLGASLAMRTDTFAAFREMLAWNQLLESKVQPSPHRCQGILEGDMRTLMDELRRVLASLGFEEPVSTGWSCGLFVRDDAVLICNDDPSEKDSQSTVFDAGANDLASLRGILGAIGTQTSIEVEVDTWDPD